MALDGHGIYGLWEGGNSLFPALDACNGHFGPVPAGAFLASEKLMYHYHTTTYHPFTIGCFGPVDSIAACKSLYSTCEGDTVSFTGKNSQGTFQVIDYDLDCPCVQHYSANASAKLS